MVGQTISHYPPEVDLSPRLMSLRLKPSADTILDKLDEGGMDVVYKVPKLPASVFQPTDIVLPKKFGAALSRCLSPDAFCQEVGTRARRYL